MPRSEEPVTGNDATTAAVVALLASEGANDLPHAGGRTLLDHLVGTASIIHRWDQPPWLQHAALVHSVYGTEAYQPQLVSPARRAEVAAAAGDRAERIAFLFHVVPRRPLLAGTHLWARNLPLRPNAGDDDPPTREELDALVLLHMANLAEQSRAADGSPGRWLARMRALADLLRDSDSVAPPLFTARLAGFEAADEAATRTAYREGMQESFEAAMSSFALAAAVCPVAPEPCVWLAYLSWCRGDRASSSSWAAHARERFAALGTAWDKRLTYEEWLCLLDVLERPAGEGPESEAGPVRQPRALFDTLVGPDRAAHAQTRTRYDRAIIAPDAEAGRRRFHRYIEGLAETEADADGRASGAVYPDLPGRPWHDPQAFAIVGYLESNFEAIRDELLALEAGRFHRESERIGRTGDWDVAFLYERGRRHNDVCAACPVTSRAIETFPTVRTPAGLIYVSRMRVGTRIEAHRGPTNLRVRCHLGLSVPDGDCAIRVADETRRWEAGKCLVFDDFYVHEAWNQSDEDRTVLIVDLWHPGLSETEIKLLEALHGHTYRHAGRLSRYWAANARAARQDAGDGWA